MGAPVVCDNGASCCFPHRLAPMNDPRDTADDPSPDCRKPSGGAGRLRAWSGAILAAAALSLALVCFASPATWRVGMDFRWRYNEALCVRSGIDPYDVCFGARPSDRFTSVFEPERGKLPVNAYTPWEYTWMLPLTHLPRETAHTVFQLLNLAALLGIAVLAWRRARRRGLPSPARWVVVAGACFLGLSLYRVLQVSNYGLVMAFAAFAMAECLDSRHEYLAGLCWAVVLVKPQIGLLLVLPLVFGRHVVALVVGAGFCALSTLPAAALCHVNPATMVWHVLHSGTHSIRAGEVGTPLLPPELVSALSGIAPPAAWLALSGVIGLALAIALSWRMRRHPDAVARLAPAIVVGLLWMPGHFHDRVLLAPVLAWLLALALDRGPREIPPAPNLSRRAFGAWLAFTAEFWAVPAVGLGLAGFAALRGGLPDGGILASITSFIDVPAFRTAYDVSLAAIGWLQLWMLWRLSGVAPASASAPAAPVSVLVYAPNWLGDAVMAMPALQAWRARHADARLTILTKRSNADLWRMHPAVDEVAELLPGTRGTFRTGRLLRARRFDAAYLLPNSFRSALIAWLAGIPRRRGAARHARSLLLTERVRLSRAPEDYHQSRETAPILLGDAFTPKTPLPAPQLNVPEELRAETLAAFGLENAPDGLVAVIPGAARGDSKRWPHFAEAARLLAEGHPARRFAILGTAAESGLCREVADAVGQAAVSVAGRTTMTQFTALLAASSAVLCNDSGGMHLAAAVGTPVVAVFGLTDWRRTGPLGRMSVVVRQDGVEGRRAIARHSAAAAAVLRSIPPGRVAAAAEWLLRQRAEFESRIASSASMR